MTPRDDTRGAESRGVAIRPEFTPEADRMIPTLELMTATWAGDLLQFNLLVSSLARSQLAALRHHVVVQSEDLPAFSAAHDVRHWQTTADLLPAELEHWRLQARSRQAALGRRRTRWAGSLAQRVGFPRWPHYVGWQTQQICKLWVARACRAEYLLVLDSDVVVTPHATFDDLPGPDRIVCLSQPGPPKDAKVLRWQAQAERLWQTPTAAPLDRYFDTPFLLHTATVRAMTDALEARHHRPWWAVMLSQPPRTWSEFATYRRFLRLHQPADVIDWRPPVRARYLFDAADPRRLCQRFEAEWRDEGCHFITVHSPSSRRRPWTAEDFVPLLMPLILL